MITKDFWQTIEQQIQELTTAKGAADVVRILATMPVVGEAISDLKWSQLIDGKPIQLSIEKLAEIVREAKAAGHKDGRLSDRIGLIESL